MFREEKLLFLETYCRSKESVMTAACQFGAVRSMLRAMSNSLSSTRDGCVVGWLNRWKALPIQILQHCQVSLRIVRPIIWLSGFCALFCHIQLLPRRWRQPVTSNLHCCTCLPKHTSLHLTALYYGECVRLNPYSYIHLGTSQSLGQMCSFSDTKMRQYSASYLRIYAEIQTPRSFKIS